MAEDVPSPFPTTRWSLVTQAARHEDGNHAIGDFLLLYYTPMRLHLGRHWRADSETLDDLLQSFVADKVLKQELLSAADAKRGRFRSFLVTALDRFASNYFRDLGRLKRGGGASSARPSGSFEAVADATTDPAHLFDVDWAREVLRRAVARMKGDCEGAGRGDVWGVFEARILGPTLHRHPPLPYEELVARFQLGSPEQASNILITAKRMFARCLRLIIGEYEEDPGRIEAELADLQHILSTAPIG